jgi:hypothetical protein
MALTITHATVKAPGNTLAAVADWNAAHTSTGEEDPVFGAWLLAPDVPSLLLSGNPFVSWGVNPGNTDMGQLDCSDFNLNGCRLWGDYPEDLGEYIMYDQANDYWIMVGDLNIKDYDVYLYNLFVNSYIYCGTVGGGETLAFDVGNRTIYENTGTFWTGDFHNCQLARTNSSLAADWGNSQLIMANGSTVSLDWNGCYLYDGGGTLSVDWQNRFLYDLSGNGYIDWSGSVYTLDINTGSLNVAGSYWCGGISGYTGALNDSTFTQIADVTGGIITAVYF